MWEGEEQDPNSNKKKATPKQKLMDWISTRMPGDVPINNFTTDWNDGRAIGALVDSCAPGLYPDYNNRKLGMAKDAMDLAEEWLGIPQVNSIKSENFYFKNLIFFLCFVVDST